MAGTIRGYHVDADRATAGPVEFRDEPSEYYRLLGCDIFDIATRFIEGHEFVFFVDDCGLLRDNPKVTAVDIEGNPALVGSLVVVARDKDNPAEVRGLTDEELDVLTDHTALCAVHTFGAEDVYVVKVIHGIEYFRKE